MIRVIATIELAKGRREEFLAVLKRLAPTVRAEAGCLEYEPMIDLPSGIPGQPPLRGDTMTMVEQWRDLAALQAHLATAHMKQFFQDTELLRVGVTLHILQPA
jgi:quinol monooxygenase YgiN